MSYSNDILRNISVINKEIIMKTINRRAFLKASLMGVGSVTTLIALSGCSSNDDDDQQKIDNGFKTQFDHGIASGDPLTDKAIIWTRVTPQGTPSSVQVLVEVATDTNFTQRVLNETTTALASKDYTIKIDVSGLNANTHYYYRFSTEFASTATGQFKTLPINNVSNVKLAVFSCANYPAGHFNVYKAALELTDLDAVVHLGDYIYEYGMGGYATEHAQELNRSLAADNANELLTLDDYRKRYALYRGDVNLQALHAKAAFIAIWDDHEVANDAYNEGAENHNADEGDYKTRQNAALQAYFEWMPIRPYVKDFTESLYRHFQFGDLVALYMLDTRHEFRVKPLEYADYIDPMTGQLDQQGFIADLSNPSRDLLGQSQLNWLQTHMATSDATWQVLGQQILMTKMNIPAELLASLANPSASIATQFQQLADIKTRQISRDPSLTTTELARINTVAPYNLDAWDGYPIEREQILAIAREFNKNLVVLAGDTHNAWAGQLTDMHGNNVGFEFATASVSSPGLEYYLGLDQPTAKQFERGLTFLVEDLRFANITQRGFMVMEFNHQQAKSTWHFVDTIMNTDFTVSTKTASVAAK